LQTNPYFGDFSYNSCKPTITLEILVTTIANQPLLWRFKLQQLQTNHYFGDFSNNNCKPTITLYILVTAVANQPLLWRF